MKITLLIIALALCCSCPTALADDRVNVLQKEFGGPYLELSPQSQEMARKYVEMWSQAFGGSDASQSLDEVYKAKLRPIVEPLRKGTPSERKVYSAAEAIYRMFEYVRSSGKSGKWDDPLFNEWLGNAKTDDPAKLSQAVAAILDDFLKIASPSQPNAIKGE
ncbi:hypothetical protein [Verrucomicrobium sp. BvORR106]|uniref:hypothetical protein n=1 Tax=Verrucomicrobium sp. BvORR106 TaxID=1403819 RepID=UPI0005711900|nr:hypothetical protein [Verrucomicrobium sp. BvORR106]